MAEPKTLHDALEDLGNACNELVVATGILTALHWIVARISKGLNRIPRG